MVSAVIIEGGEPRAGKGERLREGGKGILFYISLTENLEAEGLRNLASNEVKSKNRRLRNLICILIAD